MNCDSCNYFLSDNDSFNIHLKNCKNNINSDPKNKYYCPSCDKKFRILPNLEKHNESKKHLNLFEWNKKQLNNNNNSHTTKSINLISPLCRCANQITVESFIPKSHHVSTGNSLSYKLSITLPFFSASSIIDP